MPLKVLIVDDKESVREALKSGLSKKNVFVVEEAEDGKEALEKLARNKPDIILLDVTMPVMDGFQTYRELRENQETKNIPVIFLTARPYKDIVQNIPLSVDEYIEKPFNCEELYARINKIVKSEKK
jgi:DNA-binding response OmpR family regulator